MGCCRSNASSSDEVIIVSADCYKTSSQRGTDRFDDISLNSYPERRLSELTSRRLAVPTLSSAVVSPVSKVTEEMTTNWKIETAFLYSIQRLNSNKTEGQSASLLQSLNQSVAVKD